MYVTVRATLDTFLNVWLIDPVPEASPVAVTPEGNAPLVQLNVVPVVALVGV